jgi:hypothetical protein
VRYIVLVVSILFFSSGHLRAQITLSGTDYPTVLTGTDSFRVSTYNAAFPSFAAASAAIWDMTTITDSVPIFLGFRVPDDVYQFADSTQYHIGMFNYNGNTSSSLSSSSLSQIHDIASKRSIGLFGITAIPFDTLYIPAQTIVYSAPATRISFPCGYGNSWLSSYHKDVAFELSIDTYSLLHEPGVDRVYVNRKDTVTGWGQMRVRNSSGTPSEYFDVLQVQTTTRTTDSFFLSGVPASPVVLTMLSLYQAPQDSSFIQYYYRKGEVTPVAKVEFRDQAFTMPIRTITYFQHKAEVSINSSNIDYQLQGFPNPTKGRKIYFKLPERNAAYQAVISDVYGRNHLTLPLTTENGMHFLNLPENTVPGTYFVQLLKNGQSLGKTTVTIGE